MKPEEFATQFFDLWQQSAGQMMRDPAFSKKMLELWQNALFFAKQGGNDSSATAYHPTPASALWPDSDDGAGAKSVDELANRLELCEQRLAVLESLLRQKR